MNHSEAIESQALDAYLLDDLTGDARDAFEEHYIDCPSCAKAVYTGTIMVGAIKQDQTPQLMPQPIPAPIPFPRRVQQWLSVAAVAVFAFLLGGLAPLLQRAPAVVPLIEIASPVGAMTGVTRGAPDEAISAHFEHERRNEIVVYFSAKPRLYPAYAIELRDASGKVLGALNLTPKEALNESGVPVLLRALPAGRYVLATRGVLTDGNRPELDRRSVVVR